ncbi:MAG TPA: TetR/AcrR family transcriptional regulator C-terminal domain-containing protein [Acidimicrobiales bacterium]
MIDSVSPTASSKASRRPRKRTPRGTVSRDRVVEAAVRAVSESRYDTITIRSLANDLGVAPMTIYRHVRSRDELLDEVADVIVAKHWRPKQIEDWRRWLVDASLRFRWILVEHPAVLQVYLRHPVDSPAAVERMDEIIARLKEVGYRQAEAMKAFAALHTYTIGFAALEVSRAQRSGKLITSSDALRDQLNSFTTGQQFKVGLEFLLDGIVRRQPTTV